MPDGSEAPDWPRKAERKTVRTSSTDRIWACAPFAITSAFLCHAAWAFAHIPQAVWDQPAPHVRTMADVPDALFGGLMPPMLGFMTSTMLCGIMAVSLKGTADRRWLTVAALAFATYGAWLVHDRIQVRYATLDMANMEMLYMLVPMVVAACAMFLAGPRAETSSHGRATGA